MASKSDLIYWDSCVFIDALQKTPGRIEILQAIIGAAEAGNVRIVSSTLAIAEVVACNKDRPVPESDVKRISEFFENRYVSIRQVDRGTAELAAKIGQKHKIRPSDAVHVATAIKAKCRVLHTYDGFGGTLSPKKLLYHNGLIGVPPLAIEMPSSPQAADKQLPLLLKHDPEPIVPAEMRPTATGDSWFWRMNKQTPPHPLRNVYRLGATGKSLRQLH